jgi:hypothetical protein
VKAWSADACCRQSRECKRWFKVGGSRILTSISDVANTVSGGVVAEKTEDGVLDLIRVVEQEHLLSLGQELLVGLLLGHLTAHLHVAGMDAGKGAAVQGGPGSGRGHKGGKSDDLRVLHGC